MIVVIEFEKHMVSAYIFGIIVSKLSYWQKPSLVILLIVNKCFELCIYDTVLPLGLAVCLQIKGSEKLLFNVEKAFA